PYGLLCQESTPDTEVVSCTISTADGFGRRLNVLLQDGHVLTASQGYAVPASAFDALLILHGLLLELTQGEDTCAFIRVSDGPPPQFAISLPEKYVAVYLHEHDQRQVGLNVGLRQNPTPNIQLSDCWPTMPTAIDTGRTLPSDLARDPEIAPPNNAMQRSARVGTPLAGTRTSEDRLRSASGAPSARRR
ncbi:MAG: hypothetical protein WAW79_13010, partial [Steroidobacteraceae bacterium]